MSQSGEGGRGRADGDQGRGGGGRGGRGSGGYGQQARNRSRAVPAHGPPPKVAFTSAPPGGGSNLVALKKPAPAPASIPSHLKPQPSPTLQSQQGNGPAAKPQPPAAPKPAWGKPASPPQPSAPAPELARAGRSEGPRGRDFPTLGAEPSTVSAPTGGSPPLANGTAEANLAPADRPAEPERQASGPPDTRQGARSLPESDERDTQPRRQDSGRQGPDQQVAREGRDYPQGREDRGYLQGGREDRGYSQGGRDDRRDENRRDRGDRRDRDNREGRRDRGGGFTGNRGDDESSWRRSGPPPPADRRSRGREQEGGGRRNQDQSNRGRQSQVGHPEQQHPQGHQDPRQDPAKVQAESGHMEQDARSSQAPSADEASNTQQAPSAPQATETGALQEASDAGQAADDGGDFIEARRPKRASKDRQAAFIQSTARPGDRPLHHAPQHGGSRGRGPRPPMQNQRPQGHRPQQGQPSQPSARPAERQAPRQLDAQAPPPPMSVPRQQQQQPPARQSPRSTPPTRQGTPAGPQSPQHRPSQPAQSAPPRPVWGHIPSSVLQPPTQRPASSPRAPLQFGDLGPAAFVPPPVQGQQSPRQGPPHVGVPQQHPQAQAPSSQPPPYVPQHMQQQPQTMPAPQVAHIPPGPAQMPQLLTRPPPAAFVDQPSVPQPAYAQHAESAPAGSAPVLESVKPSATKPEQRHPPVQQQPDPHQPDRIPQNPKAPPPAAWQGAYVPAAQPSTTKEPQPAARDPSQSPASASLPPTALPSSASSEPRQAEAVSPRPAAQLDAQQPAAQERTQAAASSAQPAQEQPSVKIAEPVKSENAQEKQKETPKAESSAPAQSASAWGQKPGSAWGQKSFKDVVATASSRPAMAASTRQPVRASGPDSPTSQSSRGGARQDGGRPADRAAITCRDSRDSSVSSARSRNLEKPPPSPKAQQARAQPPAAPATPSVDSERKPVTPEVTGPVPNEAGVADSSATAKEEAPDASAASTSQAASGVAEVSVTKDIPAVFDAPLTQSVAASEHSQPSAPDVPPGLLHEPPGLQAAAETTSAPPPEATQEPSVSQEDFPSLPGPKPGATFSNTQFPATNLSDQAKGALLDILKDAGRAVLASKLRLQPRPLVNTGNLCFMNSVLQALMASSPFCSFLRTLHTALPALAPKEVPTLHAFANLAAAFQPAQTNSSDAADLSQAAASADGAQGVKNAQAASNGQAAKLASKPAPQTLLGGKPLLPEMMFPAVNKFNPRNVPVTPGQEVAISMAERLKGKRMAQREQEDAQEFLSFLLDSAHEELIRLSSTYAHMLNLSEESSSKVGADNDGGGWTKQKKGNKKAMTQETGVKGAGSLVQDLCGGQFVSQVRAAGAPQSDTTQPFMLLNLDILADGVATISDAISLYTKSNDLQDYKLKKDGPEVKATKTMQLLSLPKLLIVHLSRFAYDATMRRNMKVSKPVRFDARLGLKANWMAAECPHKKQNPQYELMATVTHMGTTSNSGHYTANVKQPSGKWLRFDDANVSVVPSAMVLDDKAYLLIYELLA